MSYTIRVQKSPEYRQEGDPELLVQNFDTEEDFQAVSKLLVSKRRIDWLESLVIPVRTDTLGNLCQDFFFPGLFNVALKTKDASLRIFLCIFMPICDVLSFPIRLITVLPRCVYNAIYPKEAHPFYQYLIDNGVDAVDLSPGHVFAETKHAESDMTVAQGITFNFMHLPASVSSIGDYEFDCRKVNE